MSRSATWFLPRICSKNVRSDMYSFGIFTLLVAGHIPHFTFNVVQYIIYEYTEKGNVF